MLMNMISNQAIWRVLVIHIIVEHQKNNNVSLGNLEIRIMELSRQTVLLTVDVGRTGLTSFHRGILPFVRQPGRGATVTDH